MLGTLLLIAVLAAVVFTARAILYIAGETRWGVTLALTSGLMFAGPALICRVAQNLVVATCLFGFACLLLVGVLWRFGPPGLRIESPSVRVHPIALLLAVILFCGVAWAALHGYWWDEHSGHFGFTAVMARGIVPPEHPLFPGEVFRYHYAFDLLAGQVRAFTGAAVDVAIDVVTLWCFFLLLLLAKEIGGALGGRRGASLALLLIPLGSATLQMFLFSDSGPMDLRLPFLPIAWAQSQPPPVLSSFFQHPQGLGMPLSLAVLILFRGDDLSPAYRRRRVLVGSLLLGALSLAQIAYFGVVGLAIGASVIFATIRSRRWVDGAFELVCLLGALALAYLLGGFLVPGGQLGSEIVFGKAYFNDPLLTQIAKHAVLFGIPLLALPFAAALYLRKPSPLRVALLTASVLGFVIPNSMAYARSWDIVKFFTIGAFFANLLLADLLSEWLKKARLLRIATFFVVVIVAASTATGWFWLVRVSIADGRWGVPALHFPPPSKLGDVTGRRLDEVIAPRDYVFSSNVDLGTSGGILTPGFNWRQVGKGLMIDRKRHEELARHKQMARRHLRRRDLEALGVSWAVFSPAEMVGLSPEGKAAIADPSRFEHLFDVEVDGQKKQVYRVVVDVLDR